MVGHVGDDAHVVGDQDDARSKALIERSKQIKNFRLNRHVERRRGLVGDEHFGVARNRLGDHRALALATRQLVRVRIKRFLWVGQFDEPEQFDGPGLCRGPREFGEVNLERLDDLEPDCIHRVHRRHRLLENHGDFTAAYRANAFGGRGERVFPAQKNPPVGAAVGWQKAE